VSIFPDLGKVEAQAADDLRTISADAIEHLKTVLNEVAAGEVQITMVR
jgi:hypothetical protein